MKIKFITFFSLVLASVSIVGGKAAAQGIYTSGTVGNDVSWPNCKVRPPQDAAFGIVGITGGKNFTPNSCLAKQSSWFKNLSLYINTGYPGQSYGLKYQNFPRFCNNSDLDCLAYNYGYNAGLYALNYASGQKVSSSTWWLDVETTNSWTTDYVQNMNSLQGQTDALKSAGVTTLGVYSTTSQWKTITNGWQNGLPSWGATTWQTAKQAATYCTGHDFTGGGTLLIQFSGKLDQDYAC